MLYNMTSGDQFRAGGASWPSTAHQQTVFYNPTYGAFSLFHDPGNPSGLCPAGGNIYSPNGPLFSTPNLSGHGSDMAQGSSLQRFMENPTVIRPYFAPKLQFGLDVPPILPNVPTPYMDRGLSHLELMTKSMMSSRPSYSSPDEKSSERQSEGGGELQVKSLSDLVVIKSERGESSLGNGGSSSGTNGKTIRTSHTLSDTAFNDGSQSVILKGKSEARRRKANRPEAQTDEWDKKYLRNNGTATNWNGNEKCNINVIDLSVSGSQKSKKKLEKLSVKCEGISDVCSRLSDKCSSGTSADYYKPKSVEPAVPSSSSLPLDSPSCSRTSSVLAKSMTQRRHNANQWTSSAEVPSISIKNEPTSFHKYVPSPSPYLNANPLPLSDIFHPSRLDLLDKYGSGGEGSVDRPLAHDFLNTRINPCYFAANLSLGSQFSNSNFDLSQWSDSSFINPFQLGAVASSSSTLLSPSTFDFSNPLGVKRESPVAATNASAADNRDPTFMCSRQTTNTSSDNVDFRLPPVGFEILRDPVTGKYLLIPAASIEALQRALFWPGYQPPALLPVSNSEPVKTSVATTIKKENRSIMVSSNQTPREEDAETRTQVTRNWLVEKVPKIFKEELNPPSVDVSGLELLSRGIEKIEQESDTCEGNMSGLGLLCALAEQRMKDEIDRPKEDVLADASERNIKVEENLKEDATVEEPGKPKKIQTRRNELNLSPKEPAVVIKRQEMSPPVLEKATDFMEDNDEHKTGPPTLTPNNEEEKPIKCEDNYGDEDRNNNNTKEENPDERLQEEGTHRKRKLSLRERSKSKKRKVGKPKLETCWNQSSSERESENRINPSSYLFRPIDPQKCTRSKTWMKSETSPCGCVPEKLSSFEIVHSELSQSPSEILLRSGERVRKNPMTEDKASASDEEESDLVNATALKDKLERRKGKLIIKLRREKIRLTDDVDNLSPKSCVLTTDSLMTDKFPIRILTVDSGLFYTGQLSAIQPPDVYGITIDGERGNRPHIYSREEILNNSILEVKPATTDELKPGTRICAYWSGQYRCLYPGSVSSSFTPDPEPDNTSVSVEFDDGDSCKISINDIRLLPENYPIVEYDPNPLLSLVKKKRKLTMKSDEDSPRKPTEASSIIVKTEAEEVPVKRERESPSADVPDPPTEYLSIKSEKRLLKKMKREKRKLKCQFSSEAGWVQKHRKKHKKHRHKHGRKHKSERNDGNTSVGENDPETNSERTNEECSKYPDRKKKKTRKDKSESLSDSPYVGGIIPGRRLWGWSGKGFRRAGVKGKARKEYYRAIQRGNERIVIGECAVFLSTGRPDRPFIGRIESMWETWGANMVVRVKWFYHPEETVGCPATLEYPGALFESTHSDENDVQTISHKCEVLPLKRYIEKLGKGARNYEGSTTLFYLAGFYDPTNTSLHFQEGVK